ncbi:MAG: YegS/Rv2252/BmrU family lipid kinase [Chitinophagaceae bacterium]|jgi:YegS/Rv2252/BmrU family lipid kinase|nr:YegS/Rv2252/BmrU family lipid kinase [Chitinophagaceae bacterium]OQY92484.1 MAG: diacylglycerol kinase [Sphingobacteriales bacterium UTBCD1]
MSRKIIYIINPISGTRVKADLEKLIVQKTKEAGISFEIFPSVAGGDYSFLPPVIKEKKITDIIIAGGDGTVSQVINGLMQHDVNFGIIPCGSGNGLAFAAKIPKQPVRALDVIFKGKAVATDGFYINNQFACMLAGLGLDAKVAYDFTLQSKRGLKTYIRLVIKNFFLAKTYPFTIELGKQKTELDAFFISIANSNQFGNNFKIAPKASLHDGLLDIVIATRQTKLSFFLHTFRQITGLVGLQSESVISKNKSLIYFQTKDLTIFNRSSAPFHIDGEPAETPGKLNIEIKEKCFRLIQP